MMGFPDHVCAHAGGGPLARGRAFMGIRLLTLEHVAGKPRESRLSQTGVAQALCILHDREHGVHGKKTEYQD
jgi:hypothetical protein